MLNTILELFTIGTAMSWIALALIALFLTILTDSDWHFTKILLITGAIALLLPFIKTFGTTNIIISILAYFIIGITYSFARWIHRINNVIQEHKFTLKKYGISDITSIDKECTALRLRKSSFDSIPYRDATVDIRSTIDDLGKGIRDLEYIEDHVDPNENKQKLLNWVFYWPWSIIKLLTADLSEAVYNTCKNQYKNIVNYLLKSNLN